MSVGDPQESLRDEEAIKTFNDWPGLAAHLNSISSLLLETLESPTGAVTIRCGFPYRTEVLGLFFVRTMRDDGAWVYAAVRVAPATGVDLDALLRAADWGPIGAISLAKDHICVGINLPVRGLRSDHLDWTIEALCAAAVRCRELAEPALQDLSLFAHLVD